MMIKSKISLLLLILSLNLSSLAKDKISDDSFSAVQKLFAAMSAFNYSAMKEATTSDFQLLEAGEVWDLKQLNEAIQPNKQPYSRRNFYKVIRTVVNNNSVWISYWNKAIFTSQGKSNDAVWLESVVVVKESGKWKLQMMHSTKASEKSLELDIDFVEYTE